MFVHEVLQASAKRAQLQELAYSTNATKRQAPPQRVLQHRTHRPRRPKTPGASSKPLYSTLIASLSAQIYPAARGSARQDGEVQNDWDALC